MAIRTGGGGNETGSGEEVGREQSWHSDGDNHSDPLIPDGATDEESDATGNYWII